MSKGSVVAGLAAGLAVTACGGSPQPLGKSVDAITVCASGPTVEGIDVSDYQGYIDWAAVRASGRLFAIAQVSDAFHRDWSFARNWQGMKDVGILRGAYQFFRPNLDPVAQADLLADAVGSLGPGDLPPMLDIEYADDGTPPGRVLGAMQTWADRVEARLGRKPIIYTGGWWWNPWTGASAQFGSYPLADSWYASGCPNIAAGWSTWTVWQYSSSGRVPGIAGNVDLDVFNGTADALAAFASGGAAPSGGPPADPCAGHFGSWCGATLGLDANTLYSCNGGVAHPIDACPNGCQVNPPGVADACIPANVQGPCTGRAPGLYCGATLGLDGNTLYSCDGGDAASESTTCDDGCAVNPPGVDDVCADPPAPAGPCDGRQDGLYCGATLGLDANTLYSCVGGGTPDVQESCASGCHLMPPGVDDACEAVPDCSGQSDGAYCGTDSVGGNADTLYVCSGGAVISSRVCANGCTTQSSGDDDFCR